MRVVALDVGSSSARAVVYDDRGLEVAGTVVRRSYEPVYGPNGEAELDASLLVTAACAVLDEARTRSGSKAVDAIAVSCFWHSLLLLDDHRRPLLAPPARRVRKPYQDHIAPVHGFSG